MSALDTVTGSFVLGDTLSPELPAPDPYTYDSYDYGYSGTTTQPAVAEIPRSEPGISFTGLLNAGSAALNTGLNIWKGVQQINMSARTAQAESQIARVQLDTNKDIALGNLELNRAQLDAKKEVALIQARSSVDQAQRAAVDARGGTFSAVASNNPLPMLLGVGALFYFLTQKGGAK